MPKYNQYLKVLIILILFYFFIKKKVLNELYQLLNSLNIQIKKKLLNKHKIRIIEFFLNNYICD